MSKLKTKVGTGEAFYIEHHFGVADAASIAKELGLTVTAVQEHVDKLKAAEVKPAITKKNNIQKAGYDTRSGVVSATGESADKGDKLPSKGTGLNAALKHKYRGDIHFSEPIHKDQEVYERL